MEFIFRDAKQSTGLQNCQARNINKLHFHYNASMSAVSTAKTILKKECLKNGINPFMYSRCKNRITEQNYAQKNIFHLWF